MSKPSFHIRGIALERSHAADGAQQSRVFQALEFALDGPVSLPLGARDDEGDALAIERFRQMRLVRLNRNRSGRAFKTWAGPIAAKSWTFRRRGGGHLYAGPGARK